MLGKTKGRSNPHTNWKIEAILLFLFDTGKIQVTPVGFESMSSTLHWHSRGDGFKSHRSHLNFLGVCKRQLLK